MVDNRGLILLSYGRWDSNSQNEKSDPQETKDARGKAFHKETSFVRSPSIGPVMLVISDQRHGLLRWDPRPDSKVFRRVEASSFRSMPLGHGRSCTDAADGSFSPRGAADGRPPASVACKPRVGNGERKRSGQIDGEKHRRQRAILQSSLKNQWTISPREGRRNLLMPVPGISGYEMPLEADWKSFGNEKMSSERRNLQGKIEYVCQDSKMPRLQDSKMPRCQDSEMPRLQDSKTPRFQDSKIPGRRRGACQGLLMQACLKPAASRHFLPRRDMQWISWRRRLEARAGIEPAHKGFADLSLTTWVPRPSLKDQAQPPYVSAPGTKSPG